MTPTTLQVCQDLALCPVQSSETGSSFNTSQWDQYDLLVATDEALAARLLAMNNDQSDAYMDKIRTLADFVPFATKNKDTDDLILVQRLEPDLWDRVAPYTHLWDDMDRVFRYATVGCSSSPLLVWQDENNGLWHKPDLLQPRPAWLTFCSQLSTATCTRLWTTWSRRTVGTTIRAWPTMTQGLRQTMKLKLMHWMTK